MMNRTNTRNRRLDTTRWGVIRWGIVGFSLWFCLWNGGDSGLLTAQPIENGSPSEKATTKEATAKEDSAKEATAKEDSAAEGETIEAPTAPWREGQGFFVIPKIRRTSATTDTEKPTDTAVPSTKTPGVTAKKTAESTKKTPGVAAKKTTESTKKTSDVTAKKTAESTKKTPGVAAKKTTKSTKKTPGSSQSPSRDETVRESNGRVPSPRTGDGVSGPAPSAAMGETERKERIAKLETEAREKFRQQNYDQAYASLTLVTQMDPSLAPPETILARWFAQIGSSRGMIAQLENATRNAPDDPEAYIHLAADAVKNERLTEASLLLGRSQQLVETYDHSPDRKSQLEKLLLTTLASYLEAKSDWKSLLGTLQSLEKQDPDNVENLVHIAQIFMKLNDEEDARRTLEKAFQKNPNLASPDALLAGLYDQERDSQNALKRIRQAITEYPENAQNQKMAVRLFFRNNDLEQANQSLHQLLQNDPKNAGIHILAGDLAIAQDQIKQAKDEYTQAILLEPSDLEAGMGYVRALILGGVESDLRKSLEIMTQTVQNSPNDTRLLLYYAWALSVNGSPERAVKIIEQILPVWTMDQDEAYLIAVCTSRLVDQTLPRRLIEAALKDTRNFMLRSRMEKLQRELQGEVTAPSADGSTPTTPTSGASESPHSTTPSANAPQGSGLPSLNPFAPSPTDATPVETSPVETPPVETPEDSSAQTESHKTDASILFSRRTSASVSRTSADVSNRAWCFQKPSGRSTKL